GKALAFLDVATQVDHQLPHGRRFGDALEQAQRLVNRHPGIHEGAQAIGEVQQVAALYPFPARRSAFAGSGAGDAYRHQLLALQDAQRLALGFGVDLAGLNIALGIIGLVSIVASTHIARVTLTTSSGVVRPAPSFSRASWRSVRMPSLIACSRMILASAPLAM